MREEIPKVSNEKHDSDCRTSEEVGPTCDRKNQETRKTIIVLLIISNNSIDLILYSTLFKYILILINV